MIIDHLGIVVKSIEQGINKWAQIFGYIQQTEMVINYRQKVKVVFLTKANSLSIKLIEPTDKSSPIYHFAKRGGGLHHICFRCEDMNLEIERLSEMGLRILSHPQPGEAFEGENISFLYVGDGLNIELIDTVKRARRLS